MEGKIQKFVLLKGYGFIIQGFKTRYFFHVRDWSSDTPPEVGMPVSFDVVPSRNPEKYELNQAVKITPVGVESGVEGAL